jgi:AcrR family transcriptional regulator
VEGREIRTGEQSAVSGTQGASRTLRSADGGSRAFYAKLHPGPGWPREQAASHQRARIYAAMIELVPERGYGAVTVRDLVRLAGVSPRTFYEHFADKDECFLRTYGLIVRRSMKQVGAAQKDCHDWRERLRLALRAWAEGIAREPKAAQLALMEAFAGGPAALEQMRRAEEHYEAMIEQSFARAPDPVPVPSLVIKGIVAGVHRVARAQLLAGRAHELPGLVDELLEWMLCFRCHAATSLAQLDAASAPAPSAPAAPSAALHIHAGAAREGDRERILDAVARVAAEEGYWQLTVPRIRAVAGVSRKRFDEYFEDVHGCFIEALERLAERTLAHAAPAGAAARTWPGGVHRALCSLCAAIAADPVLARLAFIEVFAPGPDGMLCRERVISGIAESLRTSAPAGQRPSELAAEASVDAVWGIVHHHVAVGRARQLPRLTGVLSYLVLAPAIGAEQAVEAIAAEHEAMRAGPAHGLAASAR